MKITWLNLQLTDGSDKSLHIYIMYSACHIIHIGMFFAGSLVERRDLHNRIKNLTQFEISQFRFARIQNCVSLVYLLKNDKLYTL